MASFILATFKAAKKTEISQLSRLIKHTKDNSKRDFTTALGNSLHNFPPTRVIFNKECGTGKARSSSSQA